MGDVSGRVILLRVEIEESAYGTDYMVQKKKNKKGKLRQPRDRVNKNEKRDMKNEGRKRDETLQGKSYKGEIKYFCVLYHKLCKYML